MKSLAHQSLLKKANLLLAKRCPPSSPLIPRKISTSALTSSPFVTPTQSNNKDRGCNGHYNIKHHYHASVQNLRQRKSKVYEQEEINEINNDMDKISEVEQERIKLELLTYTGTDDAHNDLLEDLSAQTKILDSLLDNNSDGNDGSAGSAGSNEKIIQKMQDVAKIHWELGMLDDAQSLQEDILKRLIQIHSESNVDDDEISQQHKKTSLPTHMDIAQTLHTIGSIQNRMNQPHEARRWFDAALKMKEEILTSKKEDGGEGLDYHYEIGKTLNGIALAEIQLAQDEDEGEDISISSVSNILSIFESAERHYTFHGEGGDNTCHYFDDEFYEGDSMADHPHVASINSNMALLYRQHGNYKMAATKYEEALRIQMMWTPTENNNDSSDNSEIIGLKMDLGDCYKAFERYERALENYEEALRLHMIVVRKERQRQRQAEQLTLSTGKSDDNASENENEKNKSMPAVLDPNADILNSPVEAVLRHNIGLMHAHLGRHDIAMEEYQSSLRIKRRLDETHPDIGLTLNGIGALQATKGDYKSALSYFREALYIYELRSQNFYAFGKEDENIMQTKKNIELVEKQMYGIGGRGNGD